MPAISTQRGSIWVAHQRARGQPALLLIHGAGSNRLQWPADLRRIPGMEMIAIDLPGHDRSPGPARDSIDDYARDVLAVLDALQHERVYLLGHSMGGAVAMTVALMQPERVRGLVLLACGAKLTVAPELLDADAATAAHLLVEWSWGPNANPNQRQRHEMALHTLEPETLRTDLTACNAFDIRPRLADITAPTLVVAGEHDQMTPPRFSTYLSDHLPNATLETLPTGHMLMLEQPQLTARVVLDWLQKRNTA